MPPNLTIYRSENVDTGQQAIVDKSYSSQQHTQCQIILLYATLRIIDVNSACWVMATCCTT